MKSYEELANDPNLSICLDGEMCNEEDGFYIIHSMFRYLNQEIVIDDCCNHYDTGGCRIRKWMCSEWDIREG